MSTTPQKRNIEKELLDANLLRTQLLDELEFDRMEQRSREAAKIKQFLQKYDILLQEPQTSLDLPTPPQSRKIKEGISIVSDKKKTNEEPLDLTPYLIKKDNVKGLFAAGVAFSIIGLFFPNTITPVIAYIILITLVAKDKV